MSKQKNAGNLLPAKEEKSSELLLQERMFFDIFGKEPIFETKDASRPNNFSAEVMNIDFPSKSFGMTIEAAKIASLEMIFRLTRDE